MTVQKRTTSIPIGGGVEEGVSDVLFEAPLVRESVNTQFAKQGSVSKRHGENVLSASLPSTSTYGEHTTIVDQDGRPAVLTQIGAYTHDSVRDLWASTGAVGPRPSRALTDRLVRQNNNSTMPEIALVTVSGKTIACIVWHDTDLLDGFYMFAEVPSDGSPLRVLSGPTMFAGTRKFATSVRLAVIGTVIYAFVCDGSATTDVYHCSCDVGSTYVFSTPATTAWASSSVPVALLTDATSLWAVLDESGGGYSIRKLTTGFVQSASVLVAGADALDAIKTSGEIVVIKSDGSLDEHTDTLPGAPTNHAVVTVGASGPLYGSAVKATLVEAASGSFFCAWERPTTAQPMESWGVVIASVSAAWSVTTSGVVGTVRLGGRAAYRSAEGLPLVPLLDVVNTAQWRCGHIGRPASDTAGLYTCAEVARYSTDIAYHQSARVNQSMVYDSASGQWLLPHLVVADQVAGHQGVVGIGVDLLRLNLASGSRTATANDLRLLAGGCGVTYLDGPVHAEMTPAPIGVINTDQTGDPETIAYGGSAAETDIHVILAPRWRDAKGNLHRAAPLFVHSTSAWDATAIGDDYAVRWRFPRPFPATIRGDKGGQDYEVEVYVAANAAGPFYYADKVTPERHPSILGVDYILISDPRNAGGIPSSVRPSGADYIADVYDIGGFGAAAVQRWTELDELVHTPTPPVVDICSTQSRVWILVAEQGRNYVRPSKLLTPGYAPEFPSALDIVIPSEGGEGRALAAMNDKIVVFKERLIYVIFGDPGDNTGAGSTLQTPRLVQGDVGVREAQSVVEGPFGVVFRGAAGGFHLLDPSVTSVTRLPQVEDSLGDYTILSGTLVADRKEVRWSARSGSTYITLVWDYEANAWATHTHPLGSVHAATVGGDYTRVSTGGIVYRERDTWSTSLDLHEARVTSAWVKTAGLLGFKRVWKAVFLLRWYSGALAITLAYDYDDSNTSTHSWTAAELAALADSDGRVELVCHFREQKIDSFRFSIAEDYPDQETTPGRGFTLLGATVEWGAKRGSHAHTVKADARR